MLQKMLQRIGIGGVQIDAVLDNDTVEIGEAITGQVHVTGGKDDWDAEAIHVELMVSCLLETQGDEKQRGHMTVAEAVIEPGLIEAGTQRAFPFRIGVPAGTPLTHGSTATAIRSRVDIAAAIDPRDSDAVRILPNAPMRAVLEAVEMCGFRLKEVETEYDRRREMPFVQEFDFRPVTRGDRRLEEVEIAFVPRRGDLEVMLTVDRRGGLFAPGGERVARFRLGPTDTDPRAIAPSIRAAIDSLT